MLQSDQFQEDLYPDTIGTCPALSARDWISGMNSPPILISLKSGFSSFINLAYDTLRSNEYIKIIYLIIRWEYFYT